MRALIVLLALPLAACGGGGGSFNSASGGTATVTTPTTGTTTTTPAPYTSTQANMFDVSALTTFNAIGAMHSLSMSAEGGTLYRGNASTVAAPSGTISYDPRDGIFVMTLADDKAGISRNITFQDPLHRTTVDTQTTSLQVPLIAGFNYLSVLDDAATNTTLTFFYQRPNSAASFVSLAGFERFQKNTDNSTLSEQGVLVFGAPTILSEIPTSGTAHFDGLFLATVMEQLGSTSVQQGTAPIQQWLNGTSAVDVDFAKRSLSLTLAGTVGPAYVKNVPVSDANLLVPSGSTFAAAGTATFTSTVNSFSGKFTTAAFKTGSTTVPVDFTPVSAGTAVAGASSIDGAFYGPGAKNIGGNFRITGGIPNQRVDILGGFVGAKP